MATKYVCDGCDKEFTEKRNNLTEVRITFNDPANATDRYSVPNDIDMDLCTRCLGTFQRQVKSLREDRVGVA